MLVTWDAKGVLTGVHLKHFNVHSLFARGFKCGNAYDVSIVKLQMQTHISKASILLLDHATSGPRKIRLAPVTGIVIPDN